MSKVMKLVKNTIAIEFDPAEGYVAPQILEVSHHRASSGKSYSYKWWKKGRWEVPMERISKSDAEQINSWWEDLSELSFYPDLINEPTVSYSVILKNDVAPLSEMQNPQFAIFYAGNLVLEEV